MSRQSLLGPRDADPGAGAVGCCSPYRGKVGESAILLRPGKHTHTHTPGKGSTKARAAVLRDEQRMGRAKGPERVGPRRADPARSVGSGASLEGEGWALGVQFSWGQGGTSGGLAQAGPTRSSGARGRALERYPVGNVQGKSEGLIPSPGFAPPGENVAAVRPQRLPFAFAWVSNYPPAPRT